MFYISILIFRVLYKAYQNYIVYNILLIYRSQAITVDNSCFFDSRGFKVL